MIEIKDTYIGMDVHKEFVQMASNSQFTLRQDNRCPPP
jgi:hypothetical protein